MYRSWPSGDVVEIRSKVPLQKDEPGSVSPRLLQAYRRRHRPFYKCLLFGMLNGIPMTLHDVKIANIKSVLYPTRVLLSSCQNGLWLSCVVQTRPTDAAKQLQTPKQNS